MRRKKLKRKKKNQKQNPIKKMIERKFVAQKIKEHEIEEYIFRNLKRVGHSHTKVQRTPLGEKIIIFASRPGLIVGRKGQSIKKLTNDLKRIFSLENPQIEISEIEASNLDAQIIAERVANSLEKFGLSKFKGIGHRTMEDVMNAGALGIEIVMSGKIPSARARKWRFYQGYLKKCGDIALTGVKKAYATAQLKTGTIGIQVKIMPAETKLPDEIDIIKEKEDIKEKSEEKEEENKKIEEKKKGEERKEDKENKKKALTRLKSKERRNKNMEKNVKDKEKGTKDTKQ